MQFSREMIKSRRVPTIVAILILLIGVTAGVVLVNKGSSLLIKANRGVTPQQVKVTNIGEDSFSVSWLTDNPTVGLVQYSTGGGPSLTARDDRDQVSGQQKEFLTHQVAVKGLKPAAVYNYKIISGGEYQVTTAPQFQGQIPANDVAYGMVTDKNGSPAEGVIVYIGLANATTLSTLTKSSGSWVIPLNLARSADLTAFATYDKEASILEIFFQGGQSGVATAVTTTKDDNPLPSISLGKSYDFRAGVPKEQKEAASASSSKFFIEETSLPVSSDLKITNPSSGEEINSAKPEIFGTGPAGESLTIIVNSPATLSAKVTVNQDGAWSWTPSSNLAPGEHTVTVSLADGRKVSRFFTVLAAGASDLPSFTATPSATATPLITVTPTVKPTLTPTPTLAGRVSLPSTASGVPKPGGLTPTLILSIMGLVLISLGLL